MVSIGPSSMAASTLSAASLGPAKGYRVFGSSPRQTVSVRGEGAVGVAGGSVASSEAVVGDGAVPRLIGSLGSVHPDRNASARMTNKRARPLFNVPCEPDIIHSYAVNLTALGHRFGSSTRILSHPAGSNKPPVSSGLKHQTRRYTK